MNETKKGFIQLHFSVLLAGFTGLFGRLITLNEVDIVWYRMLFTSCILLVFTGLPRVGWRKFLQLCGCGALLGLHWMHNPPHTRSVSGGASRHRWSMKMHHFDVRSPVKRMNKWTNWLLKQLFSGANPFTSQKRWRQIPFSGAYPFNWMTTSEFFRCIPVHFMRQ